VCGDTAAAIAQVASAARARTHGAIVTVATKSDLVPDSDKYGADIAVSAHTGAGLRTLLALVEERLSRLHGAPVLDAPGLTRARHQAAVARADAELRAFTLAWREDLLPASVASIHVRGAAEALGELIGVVQVDDVLDAVFRRFCVGK
jgi:tRNA modification GTPase